MRSLLLIAAILALTGGNAHAQVAEGGQFTMEQSVVAGGGNPGSTGGGFKVEGTSGQSVAGTRSSGSAFVIHGGFWQGAPLAPTSARVTISGRVTNAAGQGIRNARVTIVEGSGTARVATTGSFGYYMFENVETGQTVFISVRAKRFNFTEPTRVLNVNDDLADVDFVAEN
jgi:hypothetical protein